MSRIETLRLNLIDWLSTEENETVLQQVNQLRLTTGALVLTEEEKNFIAPALDDLANRRIIPDNKLLEETRKKFFFLVGVQK